MDVRCDRCGARQDVDAAKLGAAAEVRCAACGHAIRPAATARQGEKTRSVQREHASEPSEGLGAVRDASEPEWTGGMGLRAQGAAATPPPVARVRRGSRAVPLAVAAAVVGGIAAFFLIAKFGRQPNVDLPLAPPAPGPAASAKPNANRNATPSANAKPNANPNSNPNTNSNARPTPTPTATPTKTPTKTPTLTPPPAPPAAAPKPRPALTAAQAKAQQLKQLLTDAQRERDRGHPEAALQLYAEALASEPTNADALAGRGACYLDLSQYAPAEASFRDALAADGDNAAALMGLGETYRYEGRRSEAVSYYEKYLAAHPRGADAVAARNAITALKE
jgi:predicted Zn finger-like uncharacterized protein